MRTWRDAMREALYGPTGFYRTQAPAAHFRTATHGGDLLATALLRLAAEAGLRAVVDVGAGRGELLQALHRLDPGLTLTGIELADRPFGLPGAIGWRPDLPPPAPVLLVAHEWLDTVPLDVLEDGRLVAVDPDGTERAGPAPSTGDHAWCRRWWPDGERIEIGRPRDEAWAAAVGAVSGGVAVAVDYGHTIADRPAIGTLTGYRRGRQVRPVPDGLRDLTAHVAVDSVLAAGAATAGRPGRLLRQRDALAALGVDATPPLPPAPNDRSVGYLIELARAGAAAELRDPGGLGAFWWVIQPVGAVRTPLAPDRRAGS